MITAIPGTPDRQVDIYGNKPKEYDQLLKLLNETQFKDKSRSLQISLNSFISEEKRKYSQNWSAYDLAKTNEYLLFYQTIDELLRFRISKDNISKRGRPSYSTRDRIFCMLVKIYCRTDLRKCSGLLKLLKKLNYIKKVPCYKTLSNFFNDTALTQLLDELILMSALPLAPLETTGAVDATGFSISRFECWNKFKWGKREGKERLWRKAHAFVGCKTNITISVKVTRKNVADCVMFEKVVGSNPIYFYLIDLVADKAYSSRKILDFVNKMNINPYIPFKKSARGKSKTYPIWNAMFHKFKEHESAFMNRYHPRSNVETTFHMVKKRFGDSISTKSFDSNTNEIKVKFLCNNLCILIQEVFERNIIIDFESCVKKVQNR